MRLNKFQMRTFKRYPRSTRVWKRTGVCLTQGDQVHVGQQAVRIVRTADSK